MAFITNFQESQDRNAAYFPHTTVANASLKHTKVKNVSNQFGLLLKYLPGEIMAGVVVRWSNIHFKMNNC